MKQQKCYNTETQTLWENLDGKIQISMADLGTTVKGIQIPIT